MSTNLSRITDKLIAANMRADKLKAVAIEAVDYLAVNLKNDSPEDYEPEKSPLIMGLREKIEGKG